MTHQDSVKHLVAGGIAGSIGAIVTCPLEVVKTRMQSSARSFHDEGHKIALEGHNKHKTSRKSMTLLQYLRHIVKHEGLLALFKGLGFHLVGVIPSNAIYFCTYSQAKLLFNSLLSLDTPVVHICAASVAGFVTSTITNPIWFLNTRLQLDQNRYGHMTAVQCIRNIYAQSGILEFYKGTTASYIGISGTVLYFVIYEACRTNLIAHRDHTYSHSDSKMFLEYMMAAAISKAVSSCIAYPHEVARTRLREEGNKYHSFWQTIALVFREEGIRGIYGGFNIQLMRQIPNSAIVMASYEALVLAFSSNT